MPQPWSIVEVEAIVADYFAMLSLELAGSTVSKAEHRRKLQTILNERSEQSVEYKHCNISAILHDLGRNAIAGYKPRSNYQKLLREVVAERLRVDHELATLELAAVERPVTIEELTGSSLVQIVPAPRRDGVSSKVYEKRAPCSPPIVGVNYLELESRNASLGAAGESLVLELERERLLSAGKRKLANRIEHVSATRGDGLGYDIVSFEVDGRERLIEVKTTRFGQFTPFYASSREVFVSEIEHSHYHLYRLFRFGTAPKLFSLQGSLRIATELEPTMYRARLR